jgi:hypothetical protein
MDYQRLVGLAGYSGDKAEYIARKLKARNVPKENLNGLGSYFPGMGELAGENLHELGIALYAAAEMDKPMPKPKSKKTADTAVNEENENGNY